MSKPQEDRLHIYVPLIHTYNYDQTMAFAESVGKILVDKYPEKITTVWDITQRGKVFFDYNQNAKGKTIASVSQLDHLSQPHYKRIILNCIYISLV